MDIITPALIAIIAHEFGHALACLCLGVRIKGIYVGRRGVGIRRADSSPLASLYISLAGPFANLALAFVPGFALPNLILCAVNLIPFPHSDGQHAINAFRALDRPILSTRT